MSTLVECVPNFSEGRDKAVVDAIVDAMKIPGVSLLDREMDSDHNTLRDHHRRLIVKPLPKRRFVVSERASECYVHTG